MVQLILFQCLFSKGMQNFKNTQQGLIPAAFRKSRKCSNLNFRPRYHPVFLQQILSRFSTSFISNSWSTFLSINPPKSFDHELISDYHKFWSKKNHSAIVNKNDTFENNEVAREPRPKRFAFNQVLSHKARNKTQNSSCSVQNCYSPPLSSLAISGLEPNLTF